MPDAAAGGPAPTAMFAALADDNRWQILQRLGREPASASALADEFPISRQGIAKHIAVLQDVGLVTAERVGRQVQFVAAGSQLNVLARRLESIAQGWDRRLSAIKRAAEDR